jgi:hypothetical protein
MPHHNDDVVVPTPKLFGTGMMDFLMAGLPQLIPGGAMIMDYFKSFPTVFFREKKAFGWEYTNDPKSTVPKDIGIATAMWIGGHALMTDILLSSFAEASTSLPYIRALVCGLTYKSWKDPNESSSLYQWPVKLYYGDQSDLSGLRSLLAFLVGFLGARNNVGGGPWSTGGHIGLATSSAMIFNPYLFHPSTDTYDLGTFMKMVIPYTMTMGMLSKLLSSRISPTAYSVLMGLINAGLEKSKIQNLVFANLGQYSDPYQHIAPPPYHGHRLIAPLSSYTGY